MRKLLIILLLPLSVLLSCNDGGPFRAKRDITLYDKTYLIFLTDRVDSQGYEEIKYEIYKIDGDYNKFASGKSGITAYAINIGQEDEQSRKQVFKDFKKKYPDSRIYVNHKLYE